MAEVLARTLNDLERKVETLCVEINSINGTINAHKIQLAEANERISIPDEFEPFRTKVKEALNELADRQNALIMKISDHRAEIEAIMNHLTFVQTQRDKDKNDVDKLAEVVSLQKNEMILKISSIEKLLYESLKTLRDEWQKYSSLLSVKATEAPQSILQSNEQVLKKVEMACLDGANAMLKLGNLETHSRIMERRLENLDIRLKKLELDHSKA